jgi:DNA-binding SARP family transcriptional activator/tetratricopeptide (TPR) repeat protein
MIENPSLTIHLLGGFRLTAEQEPVTGLERPRLQELLAYLLLQRDRPLPRQHLAFLFWPDSTEKQALTNLRNLWYRLRQTLPHADRCLTADDLTMQWLADAPCRLDVAVFENHLAQAQTAVNDNERLHHLEQAVAQYGGDLLPGFYSDWLLAERERLAQAYGRSLEQLATLHENRRHYRQAIERTRALLRHDPLHEAAYTRLMRLHALNGDRAAALHTYHTCATILRRELDVAPGRPARELYERLLNKESVPDVPPERGAVIPLVGRETRWAQLQQLWRKAATRPQLALIRGEAGIGKTRLAEALVEWVGRQGIPALTARCYATQGELAYAPIVAWLRSRPLPPLADPWLRELARLLPEILAEHPHLPPPEPLIKPWQRLRLFEALARALLTNHSALLLFLDDWQWCDADTLDWLHFLLTDRRGQPARPQLLVVTAVRSGERGARSRLADWQAGLAHTGQLTELALGPLNQAATMALAEHVAQRPFDPALAPLLFQGTEGHPLFIVEMVRAGLAQAAPATEAELVDHAAAMLARPAALPARVRQVLEARLYQLSPAAQSVMGAAAVIGRAFTYEVLRRVVDLSEDELVNCLDESWRRRIVREQEEDAYDFSHDKLRQVAYAGLSRVRRRWLHGRVAQALEIVHAQELDSVAGVIAAHFEATRRPEPAIAYYQRAAAAARRIYAHQEALATLQKAFALLTTLPSEAPRDSLTAQLHEASGDLQSWLARYEAARAAFEMALNHTPPGEAIGQARLHRKIGQALENGKADYALVATCYETAAAILGSPDEMSPAEITPAWWEEWCQIQLEQQHLLYWWHQPDEMAAHIDRTRPLIERYGTPWQQATLLSNLSRQLNRSGRYAPSTAALDYARAALEALPAKTSPERRSVAQFGLGFNLLWHGDYAEAETVLNAALAMAEQTGDAILQTRCLAYLLITARRQGHENDVGRYAHRCLEKATTVQMFDYLGAAQAGLAWLAWRREALTEAERLAQAALADWNKHPFPYPFYWQALWPLLGLYLAQERLAETTTCARKLCDPDQQRLPTNLAESLTAALSAWDSGRPDAARQCLHHALTSAQQMNFT